MHTPSARVRIFFETPILRLRVPQGCFDGESDEQRRARASRMGQPYGLHVGVGTIRSLQMALRLLVYE